MSLTIGIGVGIVIIIGIFGLGHLIKKKRRRSSRCHPDKESYTHYYIRDNGEYVFDEESYEDEYHSNNSDFYTESDSEEKCTLCLQDILSSDSRQLMCGHQLHASCLAELNLQNVRASCPQCRTAV